MARIIPSKARSYMERGQLYRRDSPATIDDEELYHHLIRTGNFRDPDKQFRVMAQPSRDILRLLPRSEVTICRETGLGDVLMVLIVLRALHQRFPLLRLRLATGRAFVPMLQELGWLEVVSLMDLPPGVISSVVELRGVPEHDGRREVLDRIEIFAAACGVSVSDYTIPLPPLPDDAAARARGWIGSGPTIALGVRGSTHVRTWPRSFVQGFVDLAVAAGWTVAALDAHAFELPERDGVVNLCGRISLVDARAVIAASSFCVTSDSGLQHLAEASGTRCLAIYSTTPPALRIGHYRHVRALWRQAVPCVPCFDRGCPLAPCTHVPPEVVLRALENWERLGLVTNVDETDPALAPSIVGPMELEIMEAWPRACPLVAAL